MSGVLLLALGACGGNGSDTEDREVLVNVAPQQLVHSVIEIPGVRCAAGGVRLSFGADENGNGVLDSSEIEKVQTICHGISPRGAMPWINLQTDTDVQMQTDTGYIANHPSETVMLLLPTQATVGATVRITGAAAGGWQIKQSVGQTIFTPGLPGRVATPLWSPLGSSESWPLVIKTSFDGQILAALLYAPGHIQTSYDGGLSWTAQSNSPVLTWSGLAVSDNGLHMAAVGWSSHIHTSSDGGVNWIAHGAPGTQNWSAVAMSSDGQRMVALAADGHLHRTDDGGSTWQAPRLIAPGTFYGLAASADTTRLVATSHNGPIYTSSDGGATWTNQTGAGQRKWFSVIASADGLRLAAGDDGGGLYTSTDGGESWIRQSELGDHDLWTLGMSADGNYLVVSNDGGTPWVSADGSRTWLSSPVNNMDPVLSVASAGNGKMLFAASSRSGSVVGGRILQQTTPGINGSLSGGAHDALTLQYLGDDRWIVLNSNSVSTVGFSIR